ncbi:MAG: hypothetical protein ACRD3J_17200, partial [Thermoanaerobaculia bacterium]
HAIREDLKRPGLLYAGTEHGIYVSFDDGARWQSLSRNLPDTQVPDIALTGNDVVIATHGRSMYVLHDITPLREMSPSLAHTPLHLFTPVTSTRNVDDPSFKYYLGRRADNVRIDILDASGKLIKSYSGTPADSALKPPKSAVPGCTAPLRRDPRVPTKAGMNSFTWNGRYPGAVGFDCMIIWGGNATAGPMAMPGRYQVRVAANGTSETKPFIIRKDPRLIGVSDADLREQFALASKITARINGANQSVIDIRSLRTQLVERAGATSRRDIRDAITPLVTDLTRIEESLYQTRNRSGQDPLNFPIKLNDRLTALKESVEGGDSRPTAASYVVFRELSSDLDTQLSALRAIRDQHIPAINKLLATAGENPIAETAPEPAPVSTPVAPPATQPPLPTVSKWVVTPAGIGPVRAGMPVAEANAALGGILVVPARASACYYVQPKSEPKQIAFMVEKGEIARVEVQAGSDITTTEGAKIGDTEDRIKALYPGIEVRPSKYGSGHTLVMTPKSGGNNRIVFETDGKKVVSYRSGRMPAVEYVEGCG